MKRYGNIRFVRRVVVTLCLFFVAVSVLMPLQSVKADTVTKEGSVWLSSDAFDFYHKQEMKYRSTSDSAIYTFVAGTVSDETSMRTLYGIMSFGNISGEFHRYVDDKLDDGQSVNSSSVNGVNFKYYTASGLKTASCDIYFTYNSYIYDTDILNDVASKFTKYINEGVISDGMQLDVGSTAVTNESIGYLQDVKLNLSYITPIKGNSIFETTNYQIYTDMIYNLKWNGKKTSTNYDLSSSYVQLYAKSEYKSDSSNNTVTDFFALSDSKASLGKLKFSFMELFEESSNCKSAYLSDHLLASADYKNGKLQACSVTPNIKYKFYIRVYKGTDKGPWLCVSEKGSHHSNEFVNSGVKVPFNVSSGGLDSDGTYKPDGNINENGNGITGTGTDRDDADADTNANDKIQSKHDSSNTTFDKLEDFVQGIGDVPKMIADIFSFLPSWCLDVLGIGFSLLMILIVVKFIRG